MTFALLLIFFLYSIPSTKRCHDLGWSGWYQLIPFAILYLLIIDSEPGENRFGPNPKGIERVEPEEEEEHLNHTIFSFSEREHNQS